MFLMDLIYFEMCILFSRYECSLKVLKLCINLNVKTYVEINISFVKFFETLRELIYKDLKWVKNSQLKLKQAYIVTFFRNV